MPDDPDGLWDFGQGAGFYLDATEAIYDVVPGLSKAAIVLNTRSGETAELVAIDEHALGVAAPTVDLADIVFPFPDEHYLLDSSRIHVVYYGVDPEEFAAVTPDARAAARAASSSTTRSASPEATRRPTPNRRRRITISSARRM